MKACTKCGETKPLTDYYADKRNKDGRRARCKPCVLAQKAEHDARPEVKARRAEYDAEWYVENRDSVRAQNAKYNARPDVKARRAEYNQAHPEVGWESYFRARARAYGFTPRVDSFTQGDLHERWGTHCYHCGSEDGTTLDHYPTPVSRGGEHTLDNCKPSCANCQHYSWREDFTPLNQTDIGETA